MSFGSILLLSGLMIAFCSNLVIGEMNEIIGGGIAQPFLVTKMGEGGDYAIDTMGLSFVFEGEKVKNGLLEGKEAMQGVINRIQYTLTTILRERGISEPLSSL